MDALRYRARELRNAATDAERYLWLHLRRRQLGGYRIRRQVPLCGYIADFCCSECRLVIELDGGQHLPERARDERRTKVLAEHGYRVLRFWNHEVLTQTAEVLETIHSVLKSTPPQPSPASQGRERSKGEGR